MLLIWFAILFSSISWLYSLNIYKTPVPWLAWILIGLSAVFAFLGLRARVCARFDKKLLYLVIPLALSAAVLKVPYGIGPGMMAVGIILLVWPKLRPVGFGFLFVSTVLIVQSIIPGLYGALSARSPTVSGLTPLVYGVLEFLRAPVSYSQHTIFFRTMRELYDTETTWAAFGLLPGLLILAGGLVAVPLYFKRFWRKALQLALSMGVYMFVRYIFMLLFFLYVMYFVSYDEEMNKTYVLWNPALIGLTFLPFIFIAVRFLNPRAEPSSVIVFDSPGLAPRKKLAAVFLCLAAFLLTASFGFNDPGRTKKGRLIIDEFHSQWEPTTRQYDTKWYGSEAGYNYYCMAEYLGHHYDLARNLKPITPEVLAGCDVLILKIPTEKYPEEEIDAIVDFVKKGGGLLLIGDHTNVFGSSTYLNPVASRFGFKYRYDCLFDIEDVFEQVYCRPSILPHPIVQRLPPFMFEVSCSIEPKSYFPGRVILAGGLKRLGIDYSSGNFYPQVDDRLGMWFGNFHQTVAIPHGKGRVVGFSDSTVYSNFSAFIQGKPELLLAAVDWLNRQNRLAWLNRAFLIASILSFLLSAYLFPRKSEDNMGFGLTAIANAVFAVSLAIFAFGAISKATYRLPHPISKFSTVAFEQSHCDYDLPLTAFNDDPTRGYEVFYQWILRLGYYPAATHSIKESVAKGDVLVLINPDVYFSDEEVDALDGYVLKGGRLLIADWPGNKSDAGLRLMEKFGISGNKEVEVTASPAYEPTSQKMWNLGNAFELKGGTPLLFTENAVPVMTFVERGEGLVVAVSFSDAFSDANMGVNEGVIPDPDLLHHYHLQFALVKGLVEGNLKENLITADEL
jgi:hypothetical protein